MGNKKIDFRKKIRYIYFFMFVLVIGLVSFAFRWQVVGANDLRKVAEGRIYSSELHSLRGSVYAKDGSTLAFSEPRFDMYIWMEDLEFFEKNTQQTREEFLEKVSTIIDTTPENLAKVINDNTSQGVKWFRISKSLKADQWRELSQLKVGDSNRLIRGYSFTYTSERVYPENRLASHVIGLTNKHKDTVYGAGGIEGQWDGELNPTKGIRIKESDAIGQAIASSLVLTVEPKPGSSIYTTIDKKIQELVEAQTKASVLEYGAESGSTIVMDPKTGEIIALANFPDYNPNLREETDPKAYTNAALTIPYEMGSVGKVLTLAAAMDLETVKSETILQEDGHQGCMFLSDELGDLCTWDKKPQPPLPVWKCLVLSDNLCFFEIGKTIEKNVFFEYLKKFGVGERSGIDIAGESNGFIQTPDNWTIGDVAAYSYGHGYSLNAIQAISAISVIPNKGVRVQPRIVDKVVKGDGTEIDFETIALNNGQHVIKPETADAVAEIMHAAYLNDIKDYESWFQDLKNYHIGMKSGTALIANQFGYTSEVTNTQVGFDLSPDRTFVMLVKLEKPKGRQLSFYNTRIMWLQIFSQIKDYLNVPRV